MTGCPLVFCARRAKLEDMALHSDNPNTIKTIRGYIDSKCDLDYRKCLLYQQIEMVHVNHALSNIKARYD